MHRLHRSRRGVTLNFEGVGNREGDQLNILLVSFQDMMAVFVDLCSLNLVQGVAQQDRRPKLTADV